MPPLKYPPRLSRDEIRELGKVATNLMVVHDALQHTNWGGASTSAQIVGQAIEAIAKVYTRVSHFLPEVAQAHAELAAASTQQDAGAADGDPENPEHNRAGGEA